VVTSFALAATLATVSVNGFECPEPTGYFPDPQFCDKYYDCSKGVATVKNCIDGFVFNPANPRIEQCDFPFAVPCGTRSQLQNQAAGYDPQCPRANGYFAHEDAGLCNQFYFCNAGKVSKLTCPDGLHFSKESGNCAWPAASGRTGCKTRTEEVGFTCPEVSTERAAAHPRYPDPDDCKFFYVCVNGKTPRRSGCDFGSVFNAGLEKCDAARNTPGCEDYYKDEFSQLINQAGGSANVDLVESIANSFVIPEDRGTGNVNPNNRRRRPVGAVSASPNLRRQPAAAAAPQRPAGAVQRPAGGAQRPAGNRPGLRRRVRPGAQRRRKTTTTTTTTTTTPAPVNYYDDGEYYYDEADYYYYDDAAPGGGGAVAVQEPVATEAPRPAPIPLEEVVRAQQQVVEEPAPVAAVQEEPAPQPASDSRARRPFVRPQNFVRPQRPRPSRTRLE